MLSKEMYGEKNLFLTISIALNRPNLYFLDNAVLMRVVAIGALVSGLAPRPIV